MEIIRKAELEIILDIIESKPYSKILVTGAAGSGKTFLLNIVAKILGEQGRTVLHDAVGFSFINRNMDEGEPVFLLDDLDSTKVNRQVIEWLQYTDMCCVCSSREKGLGIDFDYVIELNPLSENQMLLLVSSYPRMIDSENIDIEDISKDLDMTSLTPRKVVEVIHSRLKNNKLDEVVGKFDVDIHQLYTYKGGLSLQYPEIIVPERKKIIIPSELKKDINVVTHSLLEKVAQNPAIIHTISPRQFEELVCELFIKKGYDVQLTKQTRDGGKDLIVLNSSLLGDFVIYAECKTRAPKHPVNLGFVKQLYGTVEADRVTAGIMVTNSYFSKDARRFQQTIKSRMSLIDYSDLMKQIMEFK